MTAVADQNRTRRHAGTIPRRAGSLKERYPGDMSHRPLDMLKRDQRAADLAPHLHNHRRHQPRDTIDSLDLTGPIAGVPYHHEGPFDATLKARNVDKKYAPVEAVKDTNMEALKATPAEYLQDSLIQHVPLQGTAIIPPGMKDFGGRTMEYEEGADLMRESDAPGGAYKRWEGISYRDEDLKGKGEPSFSIEQHKPRGTQRAGSLGETAYYELQPSAAKGRPTHVRQRSVSYVAQQHADADESVAGSSGLQRSDATGKSLAQSLKTRLGSLRRKKASEDRGY
ncbi:hypothetical protein VTK56DRAFT_1790 [Thermocarpiscus australiensis]